MKMLLHWTVMASLFTLPQCAKVNSVPVESIALKDFPAEPGDYWVYQVTNFEKKTVDTVTVSVTDSQKPSNGIGTLAILQVKWPGKTDTQYISIIADTVRAYAYANETGMTNAFIFPLQANDSSFQPNPRTFDNLAEIQTLSSLDTVIIQDNTDQRVKVYQIEKRFFTYAYTPMRQFYAVVDDFALGIGIIKEDRVYITGAVGKEKKDKIETWELMDVHLEPAQ